METWLDGSIDDIEVAIQGYHVYRLDHNRHGGCILIFVKNLFSCSVVFKGNPDFELIIISVNTSVHSSPDFCIALFYRPPSSDNSIFDILFSTLCNIYLSLPPKILLIGDFNVDFLCSSSLYYKLLSVVSSFNLTQIVTEPTRISKTTSTLIDLIFVSSLVEVKLCSTIPPLANADHLGLHLVVATSLRAKKPKPVTRKIWRYAFADFDQAMELLDAIEWTSTLSYDVDAYWSADYGNEHPQCSC